MIAPSNILLPDQITNDRCWKHQQKVRTSICEQMTFDSEQCYRMPFTCK